MFYTLAQNEKRYGIFPDRNIHINNICDISMYEDHEFRGCYRILQLKRFNVAKPLTVSKYFCRGCRGLSG